MNYEPRYAGVIRSREGVHFPDVRFYSTRAWRFRPQVKLIGERKQFDPWWAWGEDTVKDGKIARPALHLAAVLLCDAVDESAVALAEEFAGDFLLWWARSWSIDQAEVVNWVKAEAGVPVP